MPPPDGSFVLLTSAELVDLCLELTVRGGGGGGVGGGGCECKSKSKYLQFRSIVAPENHVKHLVYPHIVSF